MVRTDLFPQPLADRVGVCEDERALATVWCTDPGGMADGDCCRIRHDCRQRCPSLFQALRFPHPARLGALSQYIALETWLWNAARVIRGATDAPEYKDFILPLIFYKRHSDVFEDELEKHVQTYGSEELAKKIIEKDHEDALRTGRRPIVRFFIPDEGGDSSSLYNLCVLAM